VNDLEGPLKTLRGFKRVHVKAGKTTQITIDLWPGSFEFYDWNQRKMAVTPGEYEIYYGNSSDNDDLKITRIKII
jgi:beta-glucosidase